MTRYIVRELVDGKWYTRATFTRKPEAEHFARALGARAKVVEFHIPIAPRQI